MSPGTGHWRLGACTLCGQTVEPRRPEHWLADCPATEEARRGVAGAAEDLFLRPAEEREVRNALEVAAVLRRLRPPRVEQRQEEVPELPGAADADEEMADPPEQGPEWAEESAHSGAEEEDEETASETSESLSSAASEASAASLTE